MGYLDKHPLLESKDLSELRDHLSAVNSIEKIDVVGRQAEVDITICGVSIDGLDLANFRYGDALTKFHSGEGQETLQLIVTSSGSGQADYRNQDFAMSRDVGFMRDMSMAHVSSLKNIEALALFLPTDRIRDHARYLIGDRADTVVPKFDVNFDMGTPSGIHLRKTLAHVSEVMNTTAPEIQNAIFQKIYSDLMLANILILIPNSYSDLLNDRPTAKPLPRHVKRARDYIHAHAGSAITLEVLATHAGCSYRTLQLAFNEAFSMSPMAYVRHVRLTFAQADLLNADDGVDVRDIARKWGFAHMGWFSKCYLRQFGVLPSQVLRQRG